MKRLYGWDVLRGLRELLRVYRGRPPSPAPGAAGGRPRVVVILGAQVLDGGRPSRTLAARTRHAGGLYLGGGVELLIPTGAEGEHPPAEAVVMSGILRGMGVPEGAIYPEEEARSTWESALRVAEIARKRGVDEVLVVTDPLHCVRTVAAFERAGLMASAEPVYGSPMWVERWSRTGQLVRESGALVWYRIRYGVGAHSPP